MGGKSSNLLHQGCSGPKPDMHECMCTPSSKIFPANDCKYVPTSCVGSPDCPDCPIPLPPFTSAWEPERSYDGDAPPPDPTTGSWQTLECPAEYAVASISQRRILDRTERRIRCVPVPKPVRIDNGDAAWQTRTTATTNTPTAQPDDCPANHVMVGIAHTRKRGSSSGADRRVSVKCAPVQPPIVVGDSQQSAASATSVVCPRGTYGAGVTSLRSAMRINCIQLNPCNIGPDGLQGCENPF